MKYLFLLAFTASSAYATGTVYFDTSTKQILWQSAGPSLIGTSTTNISTAAINFPLPLGIVNFWDGSAPTVETPAQAQALQLAKIRRDIWELQLIKAQAGSNATPAEVQLFNRDIELLQRRVAAIQAGR